MKINFWKKGLPLFILFLILFIPHFLWLREFPVGINHDEVDVILSAKTFWKFGTDLSGVPFPKSLVATKTDAGLAGLPSFLLSPIMGSTSDLVVISRIVFVFVSLATSIFIGLCVWQFSKDKRLSLISFFISIINPWLFFYSRSPTEAPWALLFSLVGIFLLFKLDKWKVFYSVMAFVAAFYSYQGAKLVTLCLVPLLLILRFNLGSKLSKKAFATYLLTFIISVGMFFVGIKVYSGGILNQRGREVSVLNLSNYQQITYIQRQASLYFPGKYIYFNKYSNLLRTDVGKYISNLSTSLLFLHGDEMVPFAEHGLLYVIDLVFILTGLISIGKGNKKRKTLYLVTLIVFLVAPVSSAISSMGNQDIFRSYLLIPVFIILIASGIEYFINLVKGKIWIYIAIITVLTASFLNFLLFFFFRYSVDQQENHYLMERVMVNYIERLNSKNVKVEVSTDFPYRIFYEYAFFSGYFDKENKLTLFANNYYQYKNVTVSDKCGDLSSGVVVLKQGVNCNIKNDNYLVIQNPKDTGTAYKIYGDKLCNVKELTKWRENGNVADYNIEKMSDEEFCLRWINNAK